ncbi:hypothetical protein P8452_31103 [Trifolium repens]|nr:hypothetical protein P8452_31103 [Trifolium repens]
MTQILLFVFALVIYVAKISDVPCKSDSDCPMMIDHIAECVEGFCEYMLINQKNNKNIFSIEDVISQACFVVPDCPAAADNSKAS